MAADVYLPEEARCKTPEFQKWLADQGIVADDCYKLEVSGLTGVVYCYARNERGRKYVSFETLAIAVAPPAVHRLSCPPPGS